MVHKKYTKKEIIQGALASLMTILILTFYIWHITENTRLGYEIGRSENELQALREEVKKLQSQKASLLSLERIEEIAKTKLNLTEPRDDQVIYEDSH
jgi:cell division protein FtsL